MAEKTPIIGRGIGRGWRLENTGASYTTTFGISCAFYINGGQVKPCPIHMDIKKGNSNSRYVYQLVPPHNYARLAIDGSCNPRGGTTPEEFLDMGAKKVLSIYADGDAAEAFLDSAENGIIREIFEDMCRRVPGRFCYTPPNTEEWYVVRVTEVWGIYSFLKLIIEMGYEYYNPTWFWGGELKAGWITPTRQGNLIGSSRVKAPCWVSIAREFISRDFPESDYSDILEIKGNEGNSHKITFTNKVEIIQDRRAALVYSSDETEFEITHPEHDDVEGKFRGLVQFVHLTTRWE